MWQILLTFIMISCVSCEPNCKDFSNYENIVHLQNELVGEYLVVYTSSSYILECERIFWTVENNNRTAYLKDADGCCRRIDNFDDSNSEYFSHNITPLSTCSRLSSTEKVYQKLVASTGTGVDQCMIVSICHPSRSGLLVTCRKEPEPTLWLAIGNILRRLLGLLTPIPILKPVNQYNCIFGNSCFV